MHFLRRSTNPYQRQQCRTFFDAALSIKYVRDRGLDHAVEREKYLKPLVNIKNLIKSEPSKSLPLNIITQSKDSLQIPTRPIDFIRKFPSIFQEFFPASINIHPHIKLSPEVLSLDSDEELFFQSVCYKVDVADRLLKLLMIGKVNKIPLQVIDKLKWDLGLCNNYVKTILPEYPDYFQVNSESILEVVCWSHELAVSFMQKQAMKCENEDLLVKYKFALTYSNGFEMDKRYKKWVDEWQNLPYISPYENAMYLSAKSDEADKWAVAILHEILSLCVGKKAERENLLLIGEHLGLRSRFKRALMLHPGIFYVSSKIGTHTVVLKEGYKRGMLIQKNPLMELRYKYVHLMNKVMEAKTLKDMHPKSSHDLNEGNAAMHPKSSHDLNEGNAADDMEEEEVDDEEESADVYNDYDDDKTEIEARDAKPIQKLNLRARVDERKPSETSPRMFSGRNPNRAVERSSSWGAENSEQDAPKRTSRRPSWRSESDCGQDARTRTSRRSYRNAESNRERDAPTRTSKRSSWRSEGTNESDSPAKFEDRRVPISSARTSRGRSSFRTWSETSSNRTEKRTSRSSRRLEINDNQYPPRRSTRKLGIHRNRGMSEQNSSAP